MTWDAHRFDALMAEFMAYDPDDPKARKRRRVLEAATALFVKHGYRRTSVDDVARQAGVSKGAVYLHFASKADLLMHAAAFEKMRFKSRLVAILQPGIEPRDRLRMYIETVFSLVDEMPLATRLTQGNDREMHHVMQELSADLRGRMEQAQQDFLRMLLEPFAEEHGWTAEDIRDRSAVLLSVVMNASSLLHQPPTEGLPAERFARVMADMLVEGLA